MDPGLDSPGGVGGEEWDLWEQAGVRGIESWWVQVELQHWTLLLKELSPSQAQPHSCAAAAAARALWQLLVLTHLYPYFVSHLLSHSNLPGPLIDGNAWADNLVSGLAHTN
jgi:hypothetical protein